MSDHRIKNFIDEKFKNISQYAENVEGSEKYESPPSGYAHDTLAGANILWEKAFHDLFLELLDFDTGYENAKTSYTTALLNTGSHNNPQDLYQYVDLLVTRLEKIHIIKRICNYLGLQNDIDKIVDHELNLIYNHPKVSQPRVLEVGRPIAGEKWGRE